MSTLVLLAPGMGDGIQAAKAGILEVGDLFVVNKADRDGAQAVVRDLRTMVAIGPARAAGVEAAGADHRGVDRTGIAELLAEIDRFVEHARTLGGWPTTPGPGSREIEALALAGCGDAADSRSQPAWTGSPTDVAAGRLGPVRGRRRVLGQPEAASLSLNYSLRLVGVAALRIHESRLAWDRKNSHRARPRRCRATGRVVGGAKMKWVKKILFVLVVLFACFYLVNRPEDAADAVRGAAGAVGTAINSLITFFTSLAG